MQNCPACQRRLISHISPRCNWCGHEIQDAAYQAEAEARRQAHAIEQAQHDAVAQQWYQNTVNAYSPNPLGVNAALGPIFRQRPNIEQEVRMRLAAEAEIAAATQAQRAYEEAARAQQEQWRREQEERRLREIEEAKAADNRFRHLEL